MSPFAYRCNPSLELLAHVLDVMWELCILFICETYLICVEMRVGLPLSQNWLTLVRYFTRKSLMLRISVMMFCESSVVFHLNTSSLILYLAKGCQTSFEVNIRNHLQMGCFKSRLVFVSLMKVLYLLLNNTFMKLIKVNLFNILGSFWPGEMEDAMSPLSILLAWYKTFCNDLSEIPVKFAPVSNFEKILLASRSS